MTNTKKSYEIQKLHMKKLKNNKCQQNNQKFKTTQKKIIRMIEIKK